MAENIVILLLLSVEPRTLQLRGLLMSDGVIKFCKASFLLHQRSIVHGFGSC